MAISPGAARPTDSNRHWPTVLVTAAFILFVAWLVPFWSIFELNPDEGGNLAKAALVAQGLTLYREIWSDQPPLVTWVAAALFRLTGPSMLAARLLVLACAVLLVATLFSLLRRRYGIGAALVGIGLLVLSSDFAMLSGSFMIGLVSVSLFVGALGSLLTAEDAPHRAGAWLALSGCLAALAVAAKLFVLPLVVLLGLHAALHHGRRSLGFFATLAAGVAVVAWLCGGAAWPQLSQPHVVAFTSATYRQAGRMISARQNWFLLLLAATGSLVALRRRQWLPVLCLAYGAVVLVLHRPFHSHHAVLLTVPAAWLSAIAVRAVADHRGWTSLNRRARTALGGVCLIALAAVGLGRLQDLSNLAAEVVARDARESQTRRVILSTLRAHRGANPWVFTDRPVYAIGAGLLVPPELAILSKKRMELLGNGPPEFFSSVLERYDRPQVLLVRHGDYPAAFTEQLHRAYVAVDHDADDVRHFVPEGAIAAERLPRLDDFRDGIAHYERAAAQPYPRYPESDFVRIADDIVLLQDDDGGWPANIDPRVRYTDADREELARRHAELARQQEKSRRKGRLYKRIKGSSLDNGATAAEIRYLLRVFDLTDDDTYRHAALRGIAYVLASQTPCGGWPHSYPPTQDYHSRITLMDDVTIRALALLRDVGQGRGAFHAVPDAVQRRARAAHDRGLACLLRLQVRIDGRLTGWAGQYDPTTLAPAAGRPFELAGLVSRETAEVVDYLMSVDDPPPQIVEAIVGAVEWLRAARIPGVAVRPVAAPQFDILGGDAGEDLRLESSLDAPALWARFYEIPSNRPIFADRDGRKFDDWAQLPRTLRLTYEWYGPFAGDLLEVRFPAWQARRQQVHVAGAGKRVARPARYRTLRMSGQGRRPPAPGSPRGRPRDLSAVR